MVRSGLQKVHWVLPGIIEFFSRVDRGVDRKPDGRYGTGMDTSTGKRTARVRRTLTKRTVDALQPAEKPWIAWDDKLTGFGVRIQPSGTKAFIVNYRAGDGGRKAPNKRVVIGRYGPLTADKARKLAHEMLGKVAGGDDPAEDRAEARGMPTLGETFEQYMAANPNRSKRTNELYRYEAKSVSGRLASPPARRHQPRGRRSPVQQHHRRPWLVGRQPGDVPAAFDLPSALRRP